MNIFYNHYIRVDSENNVTHSFSSAFESAIEGDILIGEGGRHFNLDIYFNGIIYRWYFWGNKIIERTSEELEELFDQYIENLPVEVSDSEKIHKLQSELTNAQLALTDTYEQLIRSQEETTSMQLALVDVYEQLLLITEGAK